MLPPKITLISLSGAFGHSFARQLGSGSLAGFSMTFSLPKNRCNFPCLTRVFICYFKSKHLEVLCPWSRWKWQYFFHGLLFGSLFRLSGHVSVGLSLIYMRNWSSRVFSGVKLAILPGGGLAFCHPCCHLSWLTFFLCPDGGHLASHFSLIYPLMRPQRSCTS